MNPRVPSWSRWRSVAVGVVFALTLASCESKDAAPAGTASDGPAATTNGERPDFANTTYRGIDIVEGDITLANGKWEQPDRDGMSGGWVSLSSADMHGDLDDDGRDEWVVLLDAGGGGSGMYTYLTVFGDKDGSWRQIGAPVVLGDRIDIRDQRVEPGRIIIDVVQAGPDDPSCCPGELATLVYTLTDGHLVAQPPVVTGRLDLAGVVKGTWRLLSFDTGDDVPTEVEVTIAYADGRFSGSTGCNSYQAQVTEGGGPGAIEVSPPISTRRACEGVAAAVETRFLKCLAGATEVSFGGPGRFTLSYKQGETYGTMTFQVLAD